MAHALHYQTIDHPVETGTNSTRRLSLLAPLVACFVVALLAVIALLVVTGIHAMSQQYATRIYPLVSVGGLAVGGLTETEAVAFIQEQYARKIAIFSLPGGQWVARWS